MPYQDSEPLSHSSDIAVSFLNKLLDHDVDLRRSTSRHRNNTLPRALPLRQSYGSLATRLAQFARQISFGIVAQYGGRTLHRAARVSMLVRHEARFRHVW